MLKNFSSRVTLAAKISYWGTNRQTDREMDAWILIIDYHSQGQISNTRDKRIKRTTETEPQDKKIITKER